MESDDKAVLLLDRALRFALAEGNLSPAEYRAVRLFIDDETARGDAQLRVADLEVQRERANAALIKMIRDAAEPCAHYSQKEGKPVPRQWGSYRTMVCARCGMFRTMRWDRTEPSLWIAASEYETATAPREDD